MPFISRFSKVRSSSKLEFRFLTLILENAELCVPPGISAAHRSRYLLARNVIKNHLTLRLPTTQPHVLINTFTLLESDEFKEYLHVTPVHFVMMHDGSSRSTKTSDGTPNYEQVAKVLFRGMVWFWNNHRLNVALVNQIEFRDSKVFTMIVESFTTSSRIKLAMTAQFAAEINKTREMLEDLSRTDQQFAELQDEDLEEFADVSPVLSESYYLAAYGVSVVLRQMDCDIFMASGLILQSVILKYIPLSERRFPLVSFDEDFEEQIDEFIATLSNTICHTMEDTKWVNFITTRGIKRDAVDFIDGRLFRVVLQAMCDGTLQTGLPAAVRKDWSILCQLVMQISEEQLSMDGSTKPESSETTASKDDFEPAADNLAVLPFSHPVFDAHLKCIHVDTDQSLPARLGSMKLYRETTHWHNHKKPLTTKPPVVQKVSKWRYVDISYTFISPVETAANRLLTETH